MYPLHSTALFSLLFCSSATSLPADGNLSGCNETFSCGNITDIKFPFSGGQRPHYCGLSGFNLTCPDDSVTLLTINSFNYTVLDHIDNSNPTLTLSPNVHILTLFYSCSYVFSACDYNPLNLSFSATM